MTPSEARQVLKTLGAVGALDPDATILWTNAIARFPLDVALIAATTLIASDGRHPSLERFIVECQTQGKRLTSGALPRPDREHRDRVGLEGVRAARAQLARHPLPFPGWNAETAPEDSAVA